MLTPALFEAVVEFARQSRPDSSPPRGSSQDKQPYAQFPDQ
jgi:hypothetical protein